MKKISGAKITFTKANMAHFSDTEKTALYVFAHILNRTNLLQAQVFSHWRTAVDSTCSRIETDAALFGVFDSLLSLAGELKEAWEAIQICYHQAQLSKSLNPKLPSDAQKTLKRLPGHFTGKSVTTQLRNDFSYHHSPEKVLAIAQLLEDDDPHVAYLFSGDNNYFDFATKVRIAAVAEALGIADWRHVIERLVATVAGDVFRDISTTLNAILSTLVKKIPHEHEVTELSNILSDQELSGHFFFYIDEGDHGGKPSLPEAQPLSPPK